MNKLSTYLKEEKDAKLQGDLKDKYSIRINDQWRIVFCWDGRNSSDVEIDDYH